MWHNIKICGAENTIKTEMQSFDYHRCSASIPLSIHPSTTTHKAIHMYNLTKEDLDPEEETTLHYDSEINLSKESRGIRCRDQRDINTTAVLPWLLTIWPCCPVALCFEVCVFQRSFRCRHDEFPAQCHVQNNPPIITSAYDLSSWK